MAASDDRMPPGHQFVIFRQCDGAGFGRRVDFQSPQSYSPGYSLFSLLDTIEFANFRARRTRMNLFGVTITQRRYKLRLLAWLVGAESRIDGCLFESGPRDQAKTGQPRKT